jgi:hypothetical protein
MKRLDFVLPEFFRYMWTSEAAKAAWEPRVRAVSNAIRELEWLTVENDVRPCGMAEFSPEDLSNRSPDWIKRGLELMPLAHEAGSCSAYQFASPPCVLASPSRFVMGFAKKKCARALAEAFKSGNNEAMGKLLGYPDCCIDFFLKVCGRLGHVDTTWPMACASRDTLRTSDDVNTIRVPRPSPVNILLRGLGIRAVFHFPCGFGCSKSLEVSERLTAVGRTEGFAQEMEWLCEMLRWPMEWSALHGLAEIKTPVLKCCLSTDATPTLYRVLVEGSEVPKEAAKGIGHPYKNHRNGKRA